MSVPVIVVGAGGHARVLIDALQRAGIEVLGATDADSRLHGRKVLGVEVIGGDEAIGAHSPGAILLVNGLGTTGISPARRQLFEHFKERGYRFATVVHPSAVIAADVELLEGAQVMAGAVVQTGARVGENAIINTRASVDHDCGIGAHVHIAPGVTLSGSVVVGEGAHIGTGACVIQGVRIGRSSLVGAGAVVIRDVPEGTRVAGVPAGEQGG